MGIFAFSARLAFATSLAFPLATRLFLPVLLAGLWLTFSKPLTLSRAGGLLSGLTLALTLALTGSLALPLTLTLWSWWPLTASLAPGAGLCLGLAPELPRSFPYTRHTALTFARLL